MSEIQKGKVKMWNEEKGFGFILTEHGDLFFHASGKVGPIEKGDNVTFQTKEGKNGLNGINVKKSD